METPHQEELDFSKTNNYENSLFLSMKARSLSNLIGTINVGVFIDKVNSDYVALSSNQGDFVDFFKERKPQLSGKYFIVDYNNSGINRVSNKTESVLFFSNEGLSYLDLFNGSKDFIDYFREEYYNQDIHTRLPQNLQDTSDILYRLSSENSLEDIVSRRKLKHNFGEYNLNENFGRVFNFDFRTKIDDAKLQKDSRGFSRIKDKNIHFHI